MIVAQAAVEANFISRNKRKQLARKLRRIIFSNDKGSGAALTFAVIGAIGVLICLIFIAALKKYKWSERD